MAKPKISYESLSTAEKIAVKKRKIAKLFRELPPEKKQFADSLIEQFAVSTVTLERLVEEINNGDLIEDFVQGSQKLRRENPALKSYNATVKSFTALSKSLLDLLPAVYLFRALLYALSLCGAGGPGLILFLFRKFWVLP